MVEWLSRMKRHFSFLKLSHEPEANTVVITLRLNTYFVQGAVLAAVLFTLVFRYGSVSVGSVLELMWDLCRSGFWSWLVFGAVLTLVAVALRRGVRADGAREAAGLRSGISRLIPQGAKGTAVFCLVLLTLLLFLMWGTSFGTPSVTHPGPRSYGEQSSPEVQAQGEETPRVWREIQKGKSP